jgi:hypothetical protein
MLCTIEYLHWKWINTDRVEQVKKQFWARDPQDISEMFCEKVEILINLLGMCGIDLWIFDDPCDEQTKVHEDLQIHRSDVQDFQNFFVSLGRVTCVNNRNSLHQEWNEMK